MIDGSILSNITFGIEENKIDFNLVKEAVSLSEISSLIERLPNGINTNVGEFGSNLSGDWVAVRHS